MGMEGGSTKEGGGGLTPHLTQDTPPFMVLGQPKSVFLF